MIGSSSASVLSEIALVEQRVRHAGVRQMTERIPRERPVHQQV